MILSRYTLPYAIGLALIIKGRQVLTAHLVPPPLHTFRRRHLWFFYSYAIRAV